MIAIIISILTTILSLIVSVPVLLANVMSNAAGAPFYLGWALFATIWLGNIGLWTYAIWRLVK